jgi:hypothetical protein
MQQLRPGNIQLSEGSMSADKHRGIRRQKRKRAKDTRKKVRQQQPAVLQPSSNKSSTQQKPK